MKMLKSYKRMEHDDSIYWRRDDGCWFIWKGIMGLRELTKSLSDELEKTYMIAFKGYSEDEWEKKYHRLRKEVDARNAALEAASWEKQAMAQQDSITSTHPHPGAAVAEQNYRKGYQQGYNAAMENIKSEMEVNLTRLAAFRDNQLNGWRHQQTTEKVVGPPEYSLAHHTAAGKIKFTLEPLGGSDLSEPGEHHVQITNVEMTLPDRTEYRIYPDGSIMHQDDFESADEKYDDFEVVSIPDELIDHIEEQCQGTWTCKKCNRRVNAISYTSLCNDCNAQGDEMLEEATRTEHPIGPAPQWTPEFQERLDTNINKAKADGVYDSPTRPNEDDMMATIEELSPPYDQHPQYRDIGIRIDRYGKMVLVK
jgi:hypothetical protein